ncbi:membrane-bound PQQ-dependent dehydrogenase, glucose/quinate/shikimate family [Roseibacterium beibuensis]|uniref:membrane-bound PQQ-dependent dehydrogenase, glucose/quinate/shikimate family n=1 Tax=[Roseibacterium] beibuensis TaxID=1193142 RepID=UPI00217CDA6F|nr:membrane-bound PQQ-dependent dehydrogenase, glucose/quinate/shikimate family [Roseibacterium beibuensis]MCS6627481.1 membrane-bound PQQ-dependent dehydrogenase, glucose/quinate/shikimate family [Roseibacterium beibuensis]
MARVERSAGFGGVAVRVLAAVFLLIGVVLAIGGVWLLSLGGSFYYALAGLGLIVSGLMLWRLSIVGAWIYIGVFALTLLWALWEVGLNGWALVPRVFAPAVLLVLVIAALPVLDGRRGRRFALGGAAAFVVAALAFGVAIAQANRPLPPAEVTTAALAAMSDPSLRRTGADWPAYGGTESSRRWSPLTQINRDNVGDLERVWTFRTGDIPEEKWGAETTPLKVGDTIYLCTARNILIALDARTGEQRWRYDPRVSDEWIPYTAACRGVAYYETGAASAVPASEPARPSAAGDAASAPARPTAPVTPSTAACAARIIEGTLDGRLIAVDARTGRPCADFGTNGAVDIKVGMGEVIPGMVSITSAPTIVRGVIVTGHQVLDGQYNEAPSGVIQGFDAVTGELRWAWDMTRPDLTGRPPEGETFTRGTPNMWTTASGDEQLGLVYLPMGNSAADYYSADRSAAENRYATSLVAIDVTTGRPAWSFQTVHKDVWDYDLGSQATLIDYPTGGQVVPALVLPSKQGDLYILDRRTGRPLTPVEERPAPQGGVEPRERSRTQPHSLFHTLRPDDDLTERDMWGMSPIDQMICRIGFRQAAYDGFYTPPTSDRRWIQYPGYNGGSDWGGVAVDPRRGWIIANYNDMPNYNRLVPREAANEKGWFPRGDPRLKVQTPESRGGVPEGAEGAGDPQWGVPYAIDVNAGWRMKSTGMLCKQPPYGGIRAIDIRTGQTVWDRPLGTARKNGPFGIPSMLPLDIGTPNNGGSVVTAGGLIFIAAATDDLIRAIDIETGETVWSDVLPAGGQAGPMVYEQDGRQYLVIMAGGHHFMETPAGDYVIAYALPER